VGAQWFKNGGSLTHSARRGFTRFPKILVVEIQMCVSPRLLADTRHRYVTKSLRRLYDLWEHMISSIVAHIIR
jgi:hypothetical protein